MDLAPKNLRVDGIIDYDKDQRGLWFMYKETECVSLLNLCIDWSKFQCNDMTNLTIRWCQNRFRFNATSVWCEIYHKRLCHCGICLCM